MLDFIELAKSHSGQNMAKAFVDTLECYRIAHKGGTSSIEGKKKNLQIPRLAQSPLTTQQITTLSWTRSKFCSVDMDFGVALDVSIASRIP